MEGEVGQTGGSTSRRRRGRVGSTGTHIVVWEEALKEIARIGPRPKRGSHLPPSPRPHRASSRGVRDTMIPPLTHTCFMSSFIFHIVPSEVEGLSPETRGT